MLERRSGFSHRSCSTTGMRSARSTPTTVVREGLLRSRGHNAGYRFGVWVATRKRDGAIHFLVDVPAEEEQHEWTAQALVRFNLAEVTKLEKGEVSLAVVDQLLDAVACSRCGRHYEPRLKWTRSTLVSS